MRIHFRDLNKACPKDDFTLPITEIMADSSYGFERMTFMDWFSRCNQIKMNPSDDKHTSFKTPFGIYCYTAMPFGLKNAGATYHIGIRDDEDLRDLQHKTVECYVDDLAIKSKEGKDHLKGFEGSI